MKIRFLLFIFCLLLASCSTTHLYLESDNDVKLQNLGLYLNINESIPVELNNSLHHALDELIIDYNSKNNKLKLFRSNNPDSLSLSIAVRDVKLVTTNNQILAYAGSAVGLILLPSILIASESNFILFVWFVPRNKTFATIDISKDIYDLKYEVDKEMVFSHSGCFGSNQLNKNAIGFKQGLRRKINKLNLYRRVHN